MSEFNSWATSLHGEEGSIMKFIGFTIEVILCSSTFIDRVTQLNETVQNICLPTPPMLSHSQEELWVWAVSIVNIISTIMHHSVLGAVFADFLCQYNQNKTQLPVAIKNLPFTNYLMFVYSILQLCSQDTANIPRQY